MRDFLQFVFVNNQSFGQKSPNFVLFLALVVEKWICGYFLKWCFYVIDYVNMQLFHLKSVKFAPFSDWLLWFFSGWYFDCGIYFVNIQMLFHGNCQNPCFTQTGFWITWFKILIRTLTKYWFIPFITDNFLFFHSQITNVRHIFYAKSSDWCVANFRDKLHQTFGKIRKLL